ncbi:hypothetical protein [uncultured Amnibacterium sp.]|uniref:hypothetical protein n=1 Tax=uncultured Amnibacterium sp. TaxID=1631851 RepID=UPI0035CA9E76
MTSSLRLERSTRAGGRGGTRRSFLDFVVDGDSLADRLIAFEGGANLMSGYVPVLVLDWPTGSPAEDFRRLAGESPTPLPSGRVPMYICAECGDLGCGAITAMIEHRADTVVWRDLGYENDSEPFDPDGIITEVGPIVFDRSDYLQVLTTSRDRWSSGRRP